MGQLDTVVTTAMAEYRALPKNERGAATKQAMVSKYIGKVQSLQKSCDAEVEAVLSSLNKELKAQKLDTKIVDTLRASYKEEKSAKLAYYMSIYKR